jgi:MYXO-CTERM domain-containing protein
MLDTKGSFGMANHDAFAGTNVSGGRQGWDLTTLDLHDDAGHLVNGQTSAVIRTQTTGDSFVPAMVALELDVKSPDFTDSSTKASTETVQLDDTFEVTATLSNTGEALADNLRFVLDLDPGLELLSYETDGSFGDAAGETVTAAILATGVHAGKLGVKETRTITLSLKVIGAPAKGDKFVFAPSWEHSFTVCTGDTPIEEAHTPPSAVLSYVAEMTTGAGGAGGTSGEGGSGDGPAMIEEDSGCGCSVPGSTPHHGAAALLAGLLLMALRRRG